jgi:hypothetical protein
VRARLTAGETITEKEGEVSVVQLANSGLETLQQTQPDLKTIADTMSAVSTIGSTAVKFLQGGQKLYAYLIGRIKKEDSEPEKRPVEIQPKEHVAVLIDINRRLLHDVAAFLDAQGVDANLIIVTNSPTYSSEVRFLDVDDPEEWETLVREFNKAVGTIKREVGTAKLHFFLSTPLPLAFGLGSVWGTVDEATVYHWQAGTYHPVMPISRRLRQ